MHVRLHLPWRDSDGTVILVEGRGGIKDQLDASNIARLVLFWCVALSLPLPLLCIASRSLRIILLVAALFAARAVLLRRWVFSSAR
jgi:hypothetical protein